MTLRLFQRGWRLAVKPLQSQVADGFVFSSSPVYGHPLRMQFEVKRTLYSVSNKATIKLTNLAQDTFSAIDLGSTVILDCGYTSTTEEYPTRIYIGQVLEKRVSKEGSDIITELACGDSELQLQNCHVQVNYSSPTPLATIVDDICGQLNVVLAGQVYSYNQRIVQNIPYEILPSFCASGPARVVLDALLTQKPRNIRYSFQNGSLLIQGANSFVAVLATVLTPATGLVGVPSADKSGVQFSALLQAAIEPGAAITLGSGQSAIDGPYRVVEATYKGDTHGQEWTVDGVGEKLALPLASYSPKTSQDGAQGAQTTDEEPDFEGPEF